VSEKQTKKTASGWTDDERAAMQERARELKAEKQRGKGGKGADGETDLLAKLAEMPDEDRVMGERIHAIVAGHAPQLKSRTWYGMPAYTNEDGKVVCFYKAASKFKSRYATFGFEEDASLEEGNMWPTSYALKKLTKADEKRIVALVKQAAG
jgi:hypothetical protein